MQRENQQLRKAIDELKHSGDRIIELEVENEQLQKASMEGKTTVFTLNEVRTDCYMVLLVWVLGSLVRKHSAAGMIDHWGGVSKVK